MVKKRLEFQRWCLYVYMYRYKKDGAREQNRDVRELDINIWL